MRAKSIVKKVEKITIQPIVRLYSLALPGDIVETRNQTDKEKCLIVLI